MNSEDFNVVLSTNNNVCRKQMLSGEFWASLINMLSDLAKWLFSLQASFGLFIKGDCNDRLLCRAAVAPKCCCSLDMCPTANTSSAPSCQWSHQAVFTIQCSWQFGMFYTKGISFMFFSLEKYKFPLRFFTYFFKDFYFLPDKNLFFWLPAPQIFPSISRFSCCQHGHE